MKWNEKREYSNRYFWDIDSEKEVMAEHNYSDKEIIKHPELVNLDNVLGAIRRVLIELMEVEERRNE